YILQQMEQDSTAYNIPQTIKLDDVDTDKLHDVFPKLIRRHESFRTSFHLLAETPVQKIHHKVEFKIESYEVKKEDEQNKQEASGIIKNFVRPFDLSRPPLLRLGLIKISPPGSPGTESVERYTKYTLLVDMHHIISDGISHNLMENDIYALYRGEELLPLRIQYKDFSQWQAREQKTVKVALQENYWLKRFAGEIPLLNLPTDFPRPKIQRYEGTAVDFELSPNDFKILKSIALNEHVTHFILLLTAFNTLLSKLGRQEDIVVGVPIAGRRHADLEKIIGMFVNTLAMRNYPEGGKNFKEFLGDVGKRTLVDFENQEHQFEELVEKVSIIRDAARNPLFDVMLTMQNLQQVGKSKKNIPLLEKAAHKVERQERNEGKYRSRQTASKFDMTLTVLDSGQNLSFTLTCNSALFRQETVYRFIGYFKRTLSAIISREEITLSQIEIMSTEEKRQVLYHFNNTNVEYTEDKTIHWLFEEQAAKITGKVAVVAPTYSSKQRILTYGELNGRAHRLALKLRASGVGPGDVAAIMIEPAIEMITAILAVLKVGGCYLPIDPLNPRERTDFLLEDSETRLLLTRSQLADKLNFDGEIVDIGTKEIDDEDIEANQRGSENRLSASYTSDDPVYMIYTSGTTGKPKGVVLKHQNLVNYVNWFSTAASLTDEDKTILTSSFAFDLGYTSIFPSLLSGAQLHLLTKETYMLPESLLEYIAGQGITYLKVTPSLFSTIVADAHFTAATCRTLRLVLLGGEAINTADVEKAYRICSTIKIMNHYGPTEVTIGCIAQYIEPQHLEAYKARPTIGKPIYNTKAFILDKYLKPLPPGVAGELTLTGAGVAKGYYKREELTAEKFIPNTLLKDKDALPPYDRIYRTGDLACQLPDGYLEFLGRIDHQVKIRGYRIELGEIEERLLKHEKVKEAAVLVNTTYYRNNYLCAYFVPRSLGLIGIAG
ncbi:MAG: amino acid adenylation domain-containing protein, partial [bacterium]|nr:amino acid adenylation domain-containing protein [bacterium]